MSELRVLAAEKSRAHRSQFLYRELDAITLHTPPAIAAFGRTCGMTQNFLPFELSVPLASNQLVRVRITHLSSGGALSATPIGYDTVQ